MRPLRIAINTLSVTEENEGIRTMLTRLVPSLVRVGAHHRFRLIVSRANLELFRACGDDVDRVVLATSRRRPLARIWHDQVTVASLVREDTDVLFTPSSVGTVLTRVPQVVAVPAHLALPSLRAELSDAEWSRAHRLYYGVVMKLSHRRAAAVTPISEYLARQLVAEMGLAPRKARPILLGVDTVRPSTGSDARYALMVGTLWPYKNAAGAVEAFALAAPDLPADFRLVIAGRDPDGRQLPALAARATSLGVAGTVDLLGKVDQGKLDRLYANATVLLMPSRAEGFGLPVLEAMAHGVPVIAADRTALPEVVGDAGLLFDPDRPEELAARLVDVATNPVLSERLGVAGLRRASELSWDASAAAYVRLFEEVAR